MRICVPVPPEPDTAERPRATPGLVGAVGVIDNSKPRFDLLARSALEELARSTALEHREELYIRKPSPTRPAEADEIDRLAKEAKVVLIGSGD
jgi:hypothetical protein